MGIIYLQYALLPLDATKNYTLGLQEAQKKIKTQN